MITIKPYSGLCNRMRAIESVFGIVGDSNFRIIWENSDALNCNFDKLFITPNNVEVCNKNYKPDIYFKFRRPVIKFLRDKNINIPFGYDKYLYDTEILRLKNSNYDFGILKNYKSLYIESQHRFAMTNNAFSQFTPIDPIQEKINKVTDQFRNPIIGVHIRRGDHKVSIAKSPLTLFMDEMKKEVNLNKDVMFFLATDSAVVESTIKTTFPGRVITNKKVYDRNSVEGIQDALIDLECLSKTNKILGSYWSSFSETAALIGKIDLKILINNDR